MPRQAKLDQKNGYWLTRAGAPSGVYFGRVGVVSYLEAKRKFTEYLKTLANCRPSSQATMTVSELTDRFLDWVKEKRSGRTYDERQRHLDRFNNFRDGRGLIADLPATSLQATDLIAFVEHISHKFKVDPFTAEKHATSIKAAFNWGARHPSPTPHLPSGFRPFASVEKYKKPLDPLLERDLLTKEERDSLFHFADADLELMRENGSFRRRRPEEYRSGDSNPYVGFEDLLRVYWHTGARTSELAECRVKDVLSAGAQIVLGSHKRSKTLKEPVVRQITLNPETLTIIKRGCSGKRPEDHIFLDAKGRPWTRYRLDDRFAKVRERAAVRKEITIYSFRHLWISEILMARVDIATTAKMAGTSIAMIEKVYGHFTNDHFREAQHRLDERRNQKPAVNPAVA